MWLPLTLCFICLISVQGLDSPLGKFFPTPPRLVHDQAAGKELYLTPYIEAGKLAEGRKLARVSGLDTEYDSFSGYLTVNKTHNSNMFFWFFPSKSGNPKAPTVLWLQGGPGGSSLFGLFVENGPFSVDQQLQLHPRNFSWHNMYNMLYIDNPVGTGYSFTDADEGYATTEGDVARDLYEGLYQFFTLFESYRKTDFFITGESYAGKYIPAIGYEIMQQNPSAKMKINLKGLAIGDGLCDPINQLGYGDFLFSVGLITSRVRDEYKRREKLTKELIEEGKYDDALGEFDEAMTEYSSVTGLYMVYNYLLQYTPKDFSYYARYVTMTKVRKALHVGNIPYGDGNMVYDHLQEDFMRTVAPKIEALLNNSINILFYNGQMDVIIDYVGTQNLVEKLQWKHSQQFNDDSRKVWRVDGVVAGYWRGVGALQQVMVRNAGHILPYDQPKWAYDMIARFTSGKPFHL